mmetsp:Transcript_29845/g.45568  ORF Transcript_29845/g.45568 Transcript_29845/m.45568 type:complete len:156 (-) Transcript_29845:853-1320(-)
MTPLDPEGEAWRSSTNKIQVLKISQQDLRADLQQEGENVVTHQVNCQAQGSETNLHRIGTIEIFATRPTTAAPYTNLEYKFKTAPVPGKQTRHYCALNLVSGHDSSFLNINVPSKKEDTGLQKESIRLKTVDASQGLQQTSESGSELGEKEARNI